MSSRENCRMTIRTRPASAGHSRPRPTRKISLILEQARWSLPHLIDTVHDLEERKVGFRSLTDNIDTTTASGRMFFHLMGALAQFERDLIRERTIAGLKAARERGNVG